VTFIDGTLDSEILGYATATPEQVRAVAVRLIARGVDPEAPVTDDERGWAKDVAEMLGLLEVKSPWYRDPVHRGWKRR
jgi:hypothetical protein